jgi:hypothetical protein
MLLRDIIYINYTILTYNEIVTHINLIQKKMKLRSYKIQYIYMYYFIQQRKLEQILNTFN